MLRTKAQLLPKSELELKLMPIYGLEEEKIMTIMRTALKNTFLEAI